MKAINFTKIIIALVGISFFLPFAYLSRYVYLFSDDMSRAGYLISSLFDRYFLWVNNENGRYINALLTNLSVYDLKIQRFVPILFLVFFLLAIFYFLKSLEIRNGLRTPKLYLVTASLVVGSQVISKLPVVAHFLYWFAASTVYLLSLVALLLLSSNFIRKRFLGKYLFINCSLIIFCCGSNEMSAAIIGILLIGIFTNQIFQQKVSAKKNLLIYGGVYTLSIIPLIFLSGAQSRINYYEDQSNLLDALYRATYSTLAVSFDNIFNWHNIFLAFFFMCLFLNGYRKKISISRKKLRTYISNVVISFGCFWVSFFVLYYAVGRAAFNLDRTGNFLNVVFLIVLVFNLYSLNVFIEAREKTDKNYRYFFGVLAIILMIFNYSSTNYQTAVNDILSGKAANFSTEMKKRLEYLKKTDEVVIKLKKIEVPKTIYSQDLSEDPEYFHNWWLKELINRKYQKEIKSISLVNEGS